jgi:hypothetical protein
MGLLSGLFGSSSHSQTTSSTSNVTNTQLAGGNIAGPAIYGSDNVRVNITDGGAIQSATDVGLAALQLGAAATAAGDEVAIAGLSHAQDAYTSSLALVGDVTRNSLNNDFSLAHDAIGFAGTGLDTVASFAGTALDKVTRFGSSALDSNTYIAGKALTSTAQAYSDSLLSAANANAKALGAVEDIASQVSQSSQQTTDQTVTRIIWALVIGAIAIVVVPKLK